MKELLEKNNKGCGCCFYLFSFFGAPFLFQVFWENRHRGQTEKVLLVYFTIFFLAMAFRLITGNWKIKEPEVYAFGCLSFSGSLIAFFFLFYFIFHPPEGWAALAILACPILTYKWWLDRPPCLEPQKAFKATTNKKLQNAKNKGTKFCNSTIKQKIESEALPIDFRMGDNFIFLKENYPNFYKLGRSAEKKYRDGLKDEAEFKYCLSELRILADKIILEIFKKNGINSDSLENNDFYNRLKALEDSDLPKQIADICHQLRKRGNIAVHEVESNATGCLNDLKNGYILARWFAESESMSNCQLQLRKQRILKSNLCEELYEKVTPKRLEIFSENYENKKILLEGRIINITKKTVLIRDYESSSWVRLRFNNENKRFLEILCGVYEGNESVTIKGVYTHDYNKNPEGKIHIEKIAR